MSGWFKEKVDSFTIEPDNTLWEADTYQVYDESEYVTVDLAELIKEMKDARTDDNKHLSSE